MKILLVDDHPVARAGIRALVESMPGFEIAAEATDGAQAVEAIGSGEYDIVILDVNLPGASGLEVLGKVKRLRPELRVLVMSLSRSSVLEARALAAGADAYLDKIDAPDVLEHTLQDILAAFDIRKRIDEGEAFGPRLVADIVRSATQVLDYALDAARDRGSRADVEGLIPVLRSKSSGERYTAANLIASIGEKARESVEAFHDGEPDGLAKDAAQHVLEGLQPLPDLPGEEQED